MDRAGYRKMAHAAQDAARRAGLQHLAGYVPNVEIRDGGDLGFIGERLATLEFMLKLSPPTDPKVIEALASLREKFQELVTQAQT